MAGKALCIAGMAVAGLVMIVFLLDLLFGMLGLPGVAPFQGSSYFMDISFVLLAAGLGFLSWSTWKELD